MKGKADARGSRTRERILNVAGELFAEKGFGETTVRDICAEADVNLSAINYHFRDKENLFSEVIEFGFSEVHKKYPPDYNFTHTADPGGKLRQFIWNMLIRRYDNELPQWFPKLMSRNIQFAHSEKSQVSRDYKDKVRDVLRTVLGELIPEGNTREENVRLAFGSILGTVLFFLRSRGQDSESRIPVLNNDTDFERFVDSVYEFLLAGIQVLKN